MPWNDNLAVGSPAFEIAGNENPRVRVVAGPGTGKSFAMKRRVARLLESGVEPTRILPVTFTRVAAEDLHRELVGMDVPGCDQIIGTTLHSLALRMLMRNHVLDVTGRTARPLNAFELEPLYYDLMRSEALGKKRVKALRQDYEAAWARLQHDEVDEPSAEEAAFEVALLQWLRFHRSMLIGEVVPILYQYLSNNPAAPERCEFRHILVDEYQDLNRAEQAVVDLLSDEADVCIVGDDDQSIYSFKHARPEGIREWVELNVGATDVGLDLCRRCPTTVVSMARHLIEHNVDRPVPRPLDPHHENGQGDVSIVQYQDIDAEIAGVCAFVISQIASGVEPGDVLVLAQNKRLGSRIYDTLRAEDVPARSEYAESQLNSEAAQRAFALLKLVADREDRVAFRWLLGLGSNQWQAAGYARIRSHCEENGNSPWDVMMAIHEGELNLPYTGPIRSAFASIQTEVMALEEIQAVGELIDNIFPAGNEPLSEIRAIALEVFQDNEEITLAELVRELVTEISQPEIPEETHEVRIMSLHKSKGLSSPVTIIAGCVEGLLPRRPDPELSEAAQRAAMEEQRRLFYVGITRVKANPEQGQSGVLRITYSRQMPMADARQGGIVPAAANYGVASLHASRFIGQLGPDRPTPIVG